MSSCTVFVFASLLQFGLVNYFMDAEPLSKDMTGYSVEDLTDLDEKKVTFHIIFNVCGNDERVVRFVV